MRLYESLDNGSYLRGIGRPYAIRILPSACIPAVNVLGARCYIVEQPGFRKIMATTLRMDFLLTNDAEMRDLEEDCRAFRRAQQAIDMQREK
jgi:NitT/TauT family transport system substrate-binding protein